jgi:hypothetical protein
VVSLLHSLPYGNIFDFHQEAGPGCEPDHPVRHSLLDCIFRWFGQAGQQLVVALGIELVLGLLPVPGSRTASGCTFRVLGAGLLQAGPLLIHLGQHQCPHGKVGCDPFIFVGHQSNSSY